MWEFVGAAEAGEHEERGWSNTCYGTSKAGMVGLARVLARLERGDGVKVNACCPGYCKTDMTSHKGHRTPAKGAETPVWLALGGAGEITGGFFKDKVEVEW